MNLEVLYSRSIMEALSKTSLGSLHKPGSPSVWRLGDYAIDCSSLFAGSTVSPNRTFAGVTVYRQDK